MNGTAVNVLVVDDNVVDQEAIGRAFRRHRIANPVYSAFDGIDALEQLRGTPGRPALPRPFLVLLDLAMPRMGGIETLRELRADPDLHDSIVFVLTTSRRDEDLVASYDLNVAGYMLKSEVGTEFLRLVQLLDHYWCLVQFP